MSGSVNKVTLLGNLTRDVEIKHTQSGNKIANISLATNETWRDKQSGERKERAEFHRVVIFNSSLADIAERFLRKGSKAYLEGQLQTRKWQDQSGADRYSTEIVLSQFDGKLVLLDSRSDDDRDAGQQHDTRGGGRQGVPGDLDDDSIPFAPAVV